MFFLVNRNKGLGEQSPNELSYCLLKPDTRNVVQLNVKSIDDTENLLECVFGNNVESRRDYLLNKR